MQLPTWEITDDVTTTRFDSVCRDLFLLMFITHVKRSFLLLYNTSLFSPLQLIPPAIMPLETIYIVRHGYRSNWLPKGQQLPPPTGIDSDPCLAPHGVNQANELAEFLVDRLPEKNLPVPQVIFSSPFYRCVETINPTAEKLGLKIHLERGIGEWFKPNRPIVPIPADHEVLNSFFENVPAPMEWDWETVIPSTKGETEVDIFERCKAFWPRFISKFEAANPEVKAIVLVTHAATKISLGISLAGYNNNREFLTEKDGGDSKTTRVGGSTCSLDGYKIDKNGKWNMFMNSETSFLSHGAEMNWHFATSQFEAGSKEDIEYRRKLQLEQDKVNQKIARQRSKF